ncbi:MAG: hypothetical protein ACREE6_18890, partial [Limisphaerales bacterium]
MKRESPDPRFAPRMNRPPAKIPVLFQLAVAISVMALAPAVRAGISVPYTADANTLHLWHLNSTNNWQAPDSQSNNFQTTPM